ncbi:MAG: hypothetical protein WAW85_12555 [Gordonia sp. (in: high G+C Gram-positive bacteria)]|uniref:hypothetical protein n=1 Tax=Gordonia sp. (in: high G+C Gram-positive bacteria) TaxID=84139 RepID=UPI003BB5D646
MGTHSSNRSSALVSRPLLALVLVVVLAVAGFLTWRGLGERIDNDQAAAAGRCLEGADDVSVVVDPGIEPMVSEIAKNYNATSPVVRDHCVTVTVRAADAKATLDGLAAEQWDAESGGGPRPAAWIPESSIWAAALTQASPDALAGDAQSIVSSPVLFAVRPELAAAAGGRVLWVQMSGLTYADAFAAWGHTSIQGSARLAMPQGPQSDATSLAAQAFAANTAAGNEPLTAGEVETEQVQSGLRQIMRDPPRSGDGSAEAAVTAIAAAPSLAAAPTRSVPISEQRLFLATREDASAKVAIIRPRGQTPVLDYPMLLPAGSPAWAADTISEFRTFLRKPEQMALLTQSGFRGPGPLPQATATVDFPDLGDLMAAPEPAAVLAVNQIVFPAAAAPTR